jgi:hypothetical protein
MNPNLTQQNPNPATNSKPQIEITDERLNTVLLTLCRQYVRAKVDKEKIYLYAQARMMDHYYHGRQQLVPKPNSKGEIVDFAPASLNGLQILAGQPQDEESEVNLWTINDFRGDVNKFVAVLGTKSPNMIGRPRWASDTEATARARVGTEAASALHSEWELDLLMPQIVLSLALRGPVFYHTPYVVDAERFGQSEVEVLAPQNIKLEDDYYSCTICGGSSPVTVTECTECGAELSPAELVKGEEMEIDQPTGETKKYPNGSVELNIYSALEVTTLFYVQGIKDCPWIVLDRDREPAWVMDKLDPEGKVLGKEFRSGVLAREGDNNFTQGQQARELDGNPFGSGQPTKWTVSEITLRPLMYHYVRCCCGDSRVEGEAEAIIKVLKEKYPRGLKLVQVGNHILSKQNVSIDDEWSASKSGVGKYLWDDPWFADYASIQDMMNDAWNLEVEVRMRHFPVTYFDPQRLHPDSVNKRILPGDHIPMVGSGVGNISDALYKSSPVDVEPQSHTYIMTLRDIAREIVGLMPAVFGGEDMLPTAEQSRRKLNQALMVLAMTWNNIRNGLTRATYNGVLQLARYSGGKIVSSTGSADTASVREMPALTETLKGGWMLESDQAIPMNWSQLRDFVKELQLGSPEYQSAMGLARPGNLDLINQGVGVPGWKIPGLDARNKLQSIIRALLESEPRTEGIDPQSGQPIFGPSIPYDSFLFDPSLVVETIREWIYDDSNAHWEGSPGYDNLLYYARAAKAELDALSQPGATQAPAQNPIPASPAPPPDIAPSLPPGSNPDPSSLLSDSPLPAAPDAMLDELESIPEVLPNQTPLAAATL